MPSITSFTGETVHLLCGGTNTLNRPVDWFYQPSLDTKSRQIISAGHLVNDNFGGRMKISRSMLIIINLTVEDSGIFTCRQDVGAGLEHQVKLTVRAHGKM